MAMKVRDGTIFLALNPVTRIASFQCNGTIAHGNAVFHPEEACFSEFLDTGPVVGEPPVVQDPVDPFEEDLSVTRCLVDPHGPRWM